MNARAEPTTIVVSSCHPVIVAVVGLLFAASLSSPFQAPTVSTAAVAIPPELAQKVAALLNPQVVTVTTGTSKLEFWWVKALALRPGAAAAPSWADVPEGSLVGALRLGADSTDIRGYTIRQGVYTLRYALQPQNGDHIGVSPNREFLLPGPAAEDTSTEPIGYDGAVALAKKTSRRAHPAALSIDPPASSAAPGSTTNNDLGHKIVIVSIATAPGKALTFGLVVDGTIEQ